MAGIQEPQYRWDVFISVKRRAVFSEWIEEHFIPNLKNFLAEDLAGFCEGDCSIFYFRETLKPGDAWPKRLVDGIQTSRVALALCSPSYFQSDWCLREFQSFLDRNEDANCEVLLPVSIHDGENFPRWATSKVQFGALHDYVNTGPGFRETKKYTEFQDRIKSLSSQLADMIKGAPPYQPWRVAESAPKSEPRLIQQVRL